MEKEKRLKEIGSRVVGHLRLHLERYTRYRFERKR